MPCSFQISASLFFFYLLPVLSANILWIKDIKNRNPLALSRPKREAGLWAEAFIAGGNSGRRRRVQPEAAVDDLKDEFIGKRPRDGVVGRGKNCEQP